MAAEIGRTASKHLSSECGKATSLSSPGSDVGLDSSRVTVDTEQEQRQLQHPHYQQQRQSPPPSQQQQHPEQERISSATVQIKKTLAKTTTTTTTPSCRNRAAIATAQPTVAGNNQQQPQQQAPINADDNVTSTAEAVTEVPGAIKTTINIGFAMNHVNDQENLKQLSLAPVQVNEVEEMDTQEGECTFSQSRSFSISHKILCFFLSLSLFLFLPLHLPSSPSLSLSFSLVSLRWERKREAFQTKKEKRTSFLSSCLPALPFFEFSSFSTRSTSCKHALPEWSLYLEWDSGAALYALRSKRAIQSFSHAAVAARSYGD